MSPPLLVLASYVVGATPTSYLVGRLVYGIDLREHGSGNLGATNTVRVLGWRAGIPVAVVDVAKGWAPPALFPHLHGDAPWTWALAYAAAAIVGHVFSFWVRFRGGKGVATGGGAFLALAPWAVLVGLGVWGVVLLATRIVSVASVTAALAVPAAVALTPHRGGGALLGFALAVAVFVVWAHRSNLRRFLRGEERRFGESRARAGGPGREPS